MFAEFARDQAMTIIILGTMSLVWTGWACEDPPQRLRKWLIVGTVLGPVFAAFGVFAMIWVGAGSSNLDGRYWWFFAIFCTEIVLCAGGVLLLALKNRKRWFAWWVALVVAAHFMPLAFLFQDTALGILGLVLTLTLLLTLRRLRYTAQTTSTMASPIMGAGFLLYCAGATVGFLVKFGLPPWTAA